MRVVCDPAGNQRRSSAKGWTDIKIMESYGLRLENLKKSPSVADSVKATNRMFADGHGEARLFVHPKCIELITDFEDCYWADEEQTKQNKSDPYRTHAADGIRYLIERHLTPKTVKKPVAIHQIL